MSKYIGSDDLERVENWFIGFQDKVCLSLETLDGTGVFIEDKWERGDLGVGSTRILTEGEIFEQAGVNFSAVRGDALPPAATAKRPELVGRNFQAMGVSIVVHPKNPYVPTTHAIYKSRQAGRRTGVVVWRWFRFNALLWV
jgi:coproporphyrinogen III oxidase